MFRIASLLALLAFVPNTRAEDEPKKVAPANFVAPGSKVPASNCPDGNCSESAPPGSSRFVNRIRGRVGGPLIGSLEYPPDGHRNPIGCGNPFTDFHFVFGSCRSFFGIGGAVPPVVYTHGKP